MNEEQKIPEQTQEADATLKISETRSLKVESSEPVVVPPTEEDIKKEFFSKLEALKLNEIVPILWDNKKSTVQARIAKNGKRVYKLHEYGGSYLWFDLEKLNEKKKTV